MTDSRRKGAAGEREFAAAVHDALGVRLVRRLDQCRAGGHDLEPEAHDASDAAAVLRRFAIEVERRRRIRYADVARWWTEEAVPEARAAGLEPLLAYRADRAPWRVVVALGGLGASGRPVGEGTAPLTATVSLDGLAALVRARGDADVRDAATRPLAPTG